MKFHVITLFPDSLKSYLETSIIGRAIKAKKILVKAYNPYDFAAGKWKKTDDRPYAGGPGLVQYALPVLRAVEKALGRRKAKIILFSPSGKKFTNTLARKWAKDGKDLILISGRYEGIDARVKKILKAEEISIGDYVLTGGELPAMVVIDAVSRQIEGVLGKFESVEENRVSASEVYTRPEILEYKGKKYRAPKVLLSGDHKKIEEWKRGKKLQK
ncbi:MAG: tRNA (guanosine(37)-N1)-methyltransferase TrmD [Candidatus Paceibacterota bacterium]|jgi:tRNA (guanine37-N1)-methyltransferase